MKLYLHIGTEKTGTTSAQRWFSANREALRQQGIVYSKALGEWSNRGISLLCLENDSGFLEAGARTAEERAQHRAVLEDAFRAEVARARADGAHTFVISNEHCHSRLVRPEQVRFAAELLQPLFTEVEVLCFLRPQLDVAISLASTLSREAWPVDQAFLDGVTPGNSYYNYHLLARRWVTAFGGSFRLLSSRRWPTAAHYVIERMQLDAGRFSAIDRVNEALDVRTIAMTNRIGLPLYLPDGAINPFSQMFLGKIACKETLALGIDRARAIHSRFEQSNRDLLQEHPEFPSADLEPDWERHGSASNFELLEQPCVFADQAREMLRVFNEHLVFQRALTALVRARLALQRRNVTLAQNEFSSCKNLLDCFNGQSPSVEALPALRDQLAQFEARLRTWV